MTLLWISDLFSACMRVTKRFFCRAHDLVPELPAQETKGDGEDMANKQALNIVKMKKMKKDKIPLTVLTAYDYPSARLAEEAEVDILLVGDSLGNVVLGYDSTIPVTVDDIVHHTRAVARGAQHTFIVADLPFMSYHGSIDETLRNVRRLMQEGHAHAVKMEGGQEIAATVKTIVQSGVPVVGHIGLTPQSVNQIGGYRVQGKDELDAKRLLEDAKALEQAGACAIVLELMTEQVAALITSELSIPTIGIGAGRDCDGQVIVFHDLLKYSPDYRDKRFVKTYFDLGAQIRSSIAEYVSEVKQHQFPGPEHVFTAEDSVVENLYGKGKVEQRG